MKRTIAIMLVCAILICISGCAKVNATDLMDGIKPSKTGEEISIDACSTAVTDFSVRLFRESMDPERNTLISPLSVLAALAMTANGAGGETLSQMEETFGVSVQTLNSWIAEYMSQLPREDTYKLSLANSIWFKDAPTFQVNQDFLQTNANYYGAGVYNAPFDESTLNEINDWVSDNTDGMITNILDEIPESAVMYLVNALAFDAQWQSIYEENQIHRGSFTTEDGKVRAAEMMHSTESLYLELENAAGFLKYYDDCKYAFAALLPSEGTSVQSLIDDLDGGALHQLLADPQQTTVFAQMPKFETQYNLELGDTLQSMGMEDAFDSRKSNFDGLGVSPDGNIYVSRVLHKTFIRVDAKGTKAGAATVVEMDAEGSAAMPENCKIVTLDRPFLYMLIDCQNSIPFFIGTMMDISQE